MAPTLAARRPVVSGLRFVARLATGGRRLTSWGEDWRQRDNAAWLRGISIFVYLRVASRRIKVDLRVLLSNVLLELVQIRISSFMYFVVAPARGLR